MKSAIFRHIGYKLTQIGKIEAPYEVERNNSKCIYACTKDQCRSKWPYNNKNLRRRSDNNYFISIFIHKNNILSKYIYI